MIIGLSGYGQSGKDTVAGILGEVYDFKRYAFADALKETALAANPWVETPYSGFRRLDLLVRDVGWEDAKRFEDVRSFLQHLGMSGRDHIHQDVWLDAVRRQIEWDGPRNVVITDVRFHNEADWIERVGALVRIERPGIGPVNGHQSETEVDGRVPSYTILNSGTLLQLDTEVRIMVERLR